jgi:hypothetical protein
MIQKLCFLAKTTGPSIYIFFTDILISYRNAKKATTGKRIYPFENDITDFFPASELKIHCRVPE